MILQKNNTTISKTRTFKNKDKFIAQKQTWTYALTDNNQFTDKPLLKLQELSLN